MYSHGTLDLSQFISTQSSAPNATLSQAISILTPTNVTFDFLSSFSQESTTIPTKEFFTEYFTTKLSLLNSITIDLNQTFSVSDLFEQLGSFNQNVSAEQIVEVLVNKTFVFDISSSSSPSSMPTKLLSSEADITNCISNCSNRGVCHVNDQRKFDCICEPDFSGSNCQSDQRPCSQEPCLHFERCENVFNETIFNPFPQNVYSTFNCICNKNFYGRRCENKVDLCQNETCSGNGLCKVNQINETIYCDCFGINSFEGDKCETKTAKTVQRERVCTLLFFLFSTF